MARVIRVKPPLEASVKVSPRLSSSQRRRRTRTHRKRQNALARKPTVHRGYEIQCYKAGKTNPQLPSAADALAAAMSGLTVSQKLRKTFFDKASKPIVAPLAAPEIYQRRREVSTNQMPRGVPR